MDQQQPNEINLPAEESAPSFNRNRKHRRGAGSAKKAAERSRLRINEKVHQERQAMYEQYMNKPMPECLKAMIPRDIESRPKEIEANLSVLPTIVDKVTTVIASNFTINDQDRQLFRRNLQIVTAAQLEAKIFYSRRDALNLHQYEMSTAYMRKMREYSEMLNQNFTPINDFINSVGKFSFDNQLFFLGLPSDDATYAMTVPSLRGLSMVTGDAIPDWMPRASRPRLPLGTYDSRRVDFSGQPIYFELRNRQAGIASGIIDAEGNPLVGFDDPRWIIQCQLRGPPADQGPGDPDPYAAFRYVRAFISERRKLNSLFKTVDLTNPEGSCSQSVGSGQENGEIFALWSNLPVDGPNLLIGGAYEFGRRGIGWHDYRIAKVEASACLGNVLDQLVAAMFD